MGFYNIKPEKTAVLIMILNLKLSPVLLGMNLIISVRYHYQFLINCHPWTLHNYLGTLVPTHLQLQSQSSSKNYATSVPCLHIFFRKHDPFTFFPIFSMLSLMSLHSRSMFWVCASLFGFTKFFFVDDVSP